MQFSNRLNAESNVDLELNGMRRVDRRNIIRPPGEYGHNDPVKPLSRGGCLLVLSSLLFLIFSEPAVGKITCAKIFDAVRTDRRRGYCKGHCYRNITRLIQRLRKSRIDVTKGRVFITRVNGGTDLHVVLELAGEIYDFDKKPGISPAFDYFQKNYPAEWQGRFVITAVGANDYRDTELENYLARYSFTVKEYLDLHRPAGDR